MVSMPAFDTDIKSHFGRMVQKASGRDRKMELIRQVRKGNLRQLFPDELNLNLSFDGVPIANFVDIVAHDMSEVISPLPSLACVAGKMSTDADQQRAEKKNRIGDSYWMKSRLELQMLRGADRYVTYGFAVFRVIPDTTNTRPQIQMEDPLKSYYELDRQGNTVVFAHQHVKTVDDLCAMYPEYASYIRRGDDGKPVPGSNTLEVVEWVDKTNVSLFIPERDGLVLRSYAHKLSRLPVVVAERPGLDDTPRGQFDDVIWVQVARAIMTTLTLEAAATSAQAPIAVPEDMDEFSIGPNSILQSANARDIHRVPLGMDPAIFQENANLDQELKTGSRYPDARTGNSTASVITGKGVEALLGTFDTQVKGAQMVFRQALQEITSLCFEFDEVWYGNVSKTIGGTMSGQSYELTYTPEKDIAGRWDCTVTYGFAAGMAPSQSIITMLQLEGAGLIAKGTTQENLPFSLDHLQEQRKIDVEATREALKQGVFAYVGALGAMVQQGQDPGQVIQTVASIVEYRQDGKSLEVAVRQAFTEATQAAQAKAQAAAEAQAAAAAPGSDGSTPPGAVPPGAGGGPGDSGGPPPGVAPGQAGMPPGGMPTISDMVAGFRGAGNSPVLQDTVRRRQATGVQ